MDLHFGKKKRWQPCHWYFFFPDDKWTVSNSTWNWISCTRNHYSLDVFICIYTHKYKHTKICILYIVKCRQQSMIATCQLVLFSSRQTFPGKIMQLLSYGMGICDSSCISTVYIRPKSSRLDCVCWWHSFQVTAISLLGQRPQWRVIWGYCS